MPPKLLSSTTIKFDHSFTQENDEGAKIDEFYDMSKKGPLGEGSYGTVCKGTNKHTDVVRAIKTIERDKVSDEKRFRAEVDIQRKLDHPNIVKLYEVFKDAKNYYLVMELCTGGELFDRIVEEADKHDGESAFDERGAATYMQQILGAMNYLHEKNYVHRDIKPENFLLQHPGADAEIKIIDFGLAKAFNKAEDQPMKTKAGTPYYVAPQVLHGSYDEKCDIWSCGVIAYILICGYPPFYGEKDDEILRRVKRGEFEFPSPDWDNITGECKDLIKTMLTMDPNLRPSAGTLLDHRWIKMWTEEQKTVTVQLPATSLANLKNFKQQARLKKVALSIIAQHVKDEHLSQLKAVWSMMDDNKDGTLTIEELNIGMNKIGATFPDMDKILRAIDTDGSGKVDYTEFIAATLDHKEYKSKAVLWQAFRVFDKDGDGVITKQELTQVLQMDEIADSNKIAQIIEEVDANGDGVISFDEFSKMMAHGH
mmetsp:Transcript_44586/g.95027  ORF Transcript_44586/g.95027 Transcript_44586/m.95027 type:complete len:481 (+) Transcript_44586:90-1532(+)